MKRSFWTSGVFLGFVLWALLIVVGMLGLQAYESQPAQVARPSATWPNSTLKRGAGFTLVMFAHPRCPCTRATLHQLERLLSSIAVRPTSYAVFLQPAGWTDKELRTDIFEIASAIPGVTAMFDDDAKISHSFGSTTSGDIFLFGPDGHLAFRGGITAARGEEGECASYELLARAFKSGAVPNEPKQTLVFGCSLVTPNGARSCKR